MSTKLHDVHSPTAVEVELSRPLQTGLHCAPGGVEPPPTRLRLPLPRSSAIDIVCVLLLISDLIPTAMIWLGSLQARALREAVPPVVALLFLALGIYVNRGKFFCAPRQKSWPGLALLVAVAICLNVAGFFKLFHAMFPLSVVLVASFIWAVHGSKRLQSVLPLFFLSAFLLPDVPEAVRLTLSLPLQHLCTFLTVAFCKIFFPITGSGHYFEISGHSYNVAPSCSGLSMLASFLFAFAIFQTFEKPKRLAYFAIFLFDPVMTMILNTVRLVITAFAGYFVSQQFALSIHANLEFILVPVGLIILWIVGKRLRVVQV